MSGQMIRARLDASPMSSFQWSAIGICVLLNVLDGFDVLVMSFTASGVSREWQLSSAALGLLLSAGLAGMAAGSLFLAPLADRFGRRALILGCLALSSGGMFLSAASQSAVQLGLTRVLTGIGIGGILAASNVIAAEYANARWRGLAVSLNSTGYAVGATLGGIVAAVLQGTAGWRAVFLFGAVATALLIGAVLWRLPESLDFLLVRRSPGALARLNKLLASMKQPPLDTLPDAPAPVRPSAGVAQLLSPALRRNTLLSWLSFFLVMFGFYFVTSWTPKLLVDAGLSATQGITGGVLLNLGGIFGTALLGLLASRFPLKHVLTGYAVVTAVLLSVFVPATGTLALAFGVGLLIGLFVNGCMAGLYALTPSIYPAPVRATGVGWGIGIGRMGAILSPVVAGWLLDASWTPGAVYLLVAVFLLLGGAAVRAVRLRPATAAPAVAERGR
ncbi:MFS transporter [Amycolatopsis thermalba]|uniref:MFS transporter n=1 Tax=Amycolatopsis thermalba TaxID=944492 RepID=A0ABY4NUZ8_9PSEU|nr:MFS transporter [Amycolatopsis thermalba]UQS23904.1 MFS transporter [Amycolatopsis thermalba]